MHGTMIRPLILLRREDRKLINKLILQINYNNMNIEQGIKQFNGDERQYETVLITFDSLTLNPSLETISEHFSNRDSKAIYQELKQVHSSSQIVKLIGLNDTISHFLQFLERINRKEPNYEFQLFMEFRTYMLKVKETKELIQQYTGFRLDHSKIDSILSQILVSQTHTENQSHQNSNRKEYRKPVEEQVTPQSPSIPPPPPMAIISQPRKQDEDCCKIY